MTTRSHRRLHQTRDTATAAAVAVVFAAATAGCLGNSDAAPATPPTAAPTATQTPLPVTTAPVTPTRPATPTPNPTATGDAPPGTGTPIAPGLPAAPPAYLKLPATQQSSVRAALLSYDAFKTSYEKAARSGPTPPVVAEVYRHVATKVGVPILQSVEEDYNAGRRMRPGHSTIYRFLPLKASATNVTVLVCTTPGPQIVDKNGKSVSYPIPGLERGVIASFQLSKKNWLLLDSVQPKGTQPTCA